jgi:hypothetical protein
MQMFHMKIHFQQNNSHSAPANNYFAHNIFISIAHEAPATQKEAAAQTPDHIHN